MKAIYGERRLWASILQGFILIVTGILLIVFKQSFVAWVAEIVAVILLGNAAIRLYRFYKNKIDNKNQQVQLIIILASEVFLAGILLFYSGQTVVWIIRLIGFYHALLGIMNVISFVLLIKNKANNVFPHAFMTLVHLTLATIAFTASETHLNILTIMGAYIILIGLTFIQDGRRVFISKYYENRIRRGIRFPLPILLSVLLPHQALNKINRFLENELITDDMHQQYRNRHENSQDIDSFEIMVHASRHGFGIAGHVNISYQNKVYNYGNHDTDSRYMRGAIGDGVLAIADKEKFIEASMAAGETIFEFVVALSQPQKKRLEEKLAELEKKLVPWTLETESQRKGFGGFIQRRADAELFKFSQGKFKNYYVFGTNCVLLSDEIIGTSGLDLFAMVGFLTPGTYFAYLNREYKKDGSIVIDRKVHNRKLRKEMRALETEKPA
ncbi:MAG: hypothetical protein Q4F26_01810 [Atopococcus tabaci]|uniref:DUF308 domain-containing protein n=1 Tax=Atopococcus tabaci TaxID=269774 RepID=A0AA43UBS0_9LACT|nr:hypothetical protein [Atopococcus tabaci]